MIAKSKKTARSIGVTVIAGAVAMVFGSLAVYYFTNTGADARIFYGIMLSVLACASLAVAIYGRITPFRMLAEVILGVVSHS